MSVTWRGHPCQDCINYLWNVYILGTDMTYSAIEIVCTNCGHAERWPIGERIHEC